MTSVNVTSTALVVVQRPGTWRDVRAAIVDRLHARGDAWALRSGLTVRRVGTSRIYRDPRFALRSVATVEEVKACA